MFSKKVYLWAVLMSTIIAAANTRNFNLRKYKSVLNYIKNYIKKKKPNVQQLLQELNGVLVHLKQPSQ